MSDNQVRVILWCIPRAVSTAFVKCMSNLNDVQIINEPYESAYSAGPEKFPVSEFFEKGAEEFIAESNDVEIDYETGWDVNDATYKYVKESLLEVEYPNKKVVFVKDFSYAITYKLDMLPKGYRHAFLIRNPVKVFSSWKKLMVDLASSFEYLADIPFNTESKLIPEKYAFGESWQLYEHLIKTGIEPNPVIIDSDELLENPECILKKFCKHLGIQYTDKLLKWDAGDDVVQKWKAAKASLQGNVLGGYYKTAFASQNFKKPAPPPDRSKLSDDIKTCIDASTPYYEKFYALRQRPEDN